MEEQRIAAVFAREVPDRSARKLPECIIGIQYAGEVGTCDSAYRGIA